MGERATNRTLLLRFSLFVLLVPGAGHYFDYICLGYSASNGCVHVRSLLFPSRCVPSGYSPDITQAYVLEWLSSGREMFCFVFYLVCYPFLAGPLG